MDSVTQHKSFREYYRSILERYREEIKQALPDNIDVDRFIQVALITITKKREIYSCTKGSVIGAILTAASLGLFIDDDLGEAFIIKGYNELTKKNEAQILIGYQGFNVLALRSGFVEFMQPRYVCEGDFFEYEYGLEDVLKHKPTATDRSNDKITHFYIVVKLTAGSKIFNVMTRAEVEQARDNSPHYKAATDKTKTIWHIFFNKMGNKTVFRSMVKYIPLSPQLQLAIKLDEQLEYGTQDLSKLALELPDIDSEVEQEVITDLAAQEEQKAKDSKKARNNKKVAEALTSLDGILKNNSKK